MANIYKRSIIFETLIAFSCSSQLLLKDLFWLFERLSERERSPIHYFSAEMAPMAGTSPGQIQEPWSSVWFSLMREPQENWGIGIFCHLPVL